MLSNRKTQLIVLVAALLAVGGGLYFTGMIGGGKDAPAIKRSPTPITLNKPFIINLADTDDQYFIKLQLAVTLEPMGPEELDMFKTGGQGEHGAKDENTGPAKVAAYPPLQDAVIEVTSRFTSAELLTPAGKAEFKKALLERFEQIAADDTPTGKGWVHNVAEPPYNISSVQLQEFAIQAP